MRRPLAFLLAGVMALAAVACASAASPQAAARCSAGWIDQPVSFQAGGMTVDATYRHPCHLARRIPAVLLIAGSGPTDRNGNTPSATHQNTIRTLADWLSEDGVATLRYDKLGSGATGLGRYASDPAAIGIAPYEQEAAEGLRFLAAQPGVDRARLGVFGHSEGALFALLLATGHGDGVTVPHVHALGLIEPLSMRYLTLDTAKVISAVQGEVADGRITSAQGAAVDQSLARVVARLRAGRRMGSDLNPEITAAIPPLVAHFLAQADRYDPATLGASLPAGTPVLTSCSDDDIEITCDDVAHLVGGLEQAHVRLDQVHLTNMDHLLKVDTSLSTRYYDATLPFSPQLQAAIAAYVRTAL